MTIRMGIWNLIKQNFKRASESLIARYIICFNVIMLHKFYVNIEISFVENKPEIFWKYGLFIEFYIKILFTYI